MELGSDEAVDGVAVDEARHSVLFHAFPETVDARPGNHLFHFAKQFMGVVNARDAFEPGHEKNGKDGVEVYGAEEVIAAEEEVEEQADIEFGIKEESFGEEAGEAFLMVWLIAKGDGSAERPADQGNVVAMCGQGGANAYHPLVVAEVVGYCKSQKSGPFHHLPVLDNIRGKNRKK